VKSLVSLSWCIRSDTLGEGDGDADYLPPMVKKFDYSCFDRIPACDGLTDNLSTALYIAYCAVCGVIHRPT